MKFPRALVCAFLLAFQLSPAIAFWHGISSQKVGQTVLNFRAPTSSFINLAHSIGQASATANWPSLLTAHGYPTSSLTGAITNNNLAFIPNYYARYKIWWTGTGAFQISPGSIVYSGGTSTQLNSASGSLFGNFSIGYAGASTQPTSGTPVEFAIGALVNAVADGGSCTGGTAGLVCLTASIASGFSQFSTGSTAQIHNVNNLSATTIWTITKLDSTHIQLQGSTYSGSMSINSGSPGTQSEAIFAPSAATWTFPAQGTSSAAYSSMDGMIVCRSQNIGTNGTDDCTDIINNSHLVNPDYVSTIKSLNPRFVRFMDFIAVQNNKSTNYTYRPSTANLSWGNNQVLAYYGGTITNGGSDAYTVSNPSASPASGAYVDGEVVVGQISGANTGLNPTLQISARTGAIAAPIYNSSLSLLGMTMTGSVPPTATTISLVFTGGGLASPFTYNYLTSTSSNGPGGVTDTSFNNIAINIRADINGNVRGNAGALVTAGIASANAEQNNAQMTFKYNPNINSSGTATLGNGLSMTGSDSASSATYSFGVMAASDLVNGNYGTFTWSKLLQGWIFVGVSATRSGLNGGPPLEFYEELCTRANVGMGYNVGLFYDSTYITNLVTSIANSGVKELTLELSNETWNSSEAEFGPTQNLGMLVGLLFSSNASVNGYYGLKVAEMASLARTAWAAAGRSQSQLFISDAYQFVSPDQTNRFNGGNLNASGTGTNVTLKAFGGFGATAITTDYSTFPNRPVDWSDFVSPAPYFQGVQFNSTFGTSIKTGGVLLAVYNCSLVASYNYVNGNASQQSAALDFMFNGSSGDFYTTTPLSGASIGLALAAYAHGSGVTGADYYGIASIVSGYDATRTGTNPHTSLPWQALGVAAYEGDAEAGPVDSTTAATIATSLTGLGDTSGYTSGLGSSCGMTPAGGGPTSTPSTDGTNMLALLNAFKLDNRYNLLYQKYFSDFKTSITSGGARIALPATFGFEGGGYWGKYTGTIYSTSYGSVTAIQTQNN